MKEVTYEEVFKDIPGYEGLYQISNLGNVKALSTRKMRGQYFQLRPEIILKPSIKNNGYLQVTLHNSIGHKKFISVHCLVAICFIPNPKNKSTVNHKDGNKINNIYSNLEWATHKDQVEHADNMGLRNIKGSKHKRSKLTDSQVLEIRSRSLIQNLTSLSEVFQVNKSCICKIVNRQSWKHI